MEKAAIAIQSHLRGFLSRKKYKILNNMDKNMQNVQKDLENQKETSKQSEKKEEVQKKQLKIDNLEELISCGTFDSPNKHTTPIDLGSELASFRIHLEEGIQSSNSFTQDLSILMGPIAVSPIAVTSGNFTSQVNLRGPPPPKITTKNIIVPEDDIDESINLLSPNLKKLKFIQNTPTFPVKEEEHNITWGKIELGEKKEEDNGMKSIINIQIPNFDDLSSIPDCSKSISNFNDVPQMISESIVDIPANNSKPQEENYIGKANESLKVEQKNNDIACETGENPNFFEDNKEVYDKFNDTIGFNKSNVSIIEEEHKKIEPKIERRNRIIISTKNPIIRPLSHSKGKSLKNVLDPLNNSQKSLNRKSNSNNSLHSRGIIFQGSQPERPLIVNVLNNNFVSPAFKNLGNSPPNLSHIKRASSKSLAKIKINPYSSEWNQSTLKNHFKVQMKVSNQVSGVKVLLKKISKKKVKIPK